MQTLSIVELKKIFQEGKLSEQELALFRQDERKGVQALLRSYEKRQEARRQMQAQFLQMKAFDEAYKKSKESLLAGVDEAGRGPLAGPVVSAAVILPEDFICYGITDSKKLSEKERAQYGDYIMQHAIDYQIAIIDHQVIDSTNILEATKRSMQEAICSLKKAPQVTLLDAVSLQVPERKIISIIKGDEQSLSIAAASILAKITRDRIMEEYDRAYPEYGFKDHKGYGSRQHMEALKKYGPSPIHRRTFRPVAAMLES